MVFGRVFVGVGRGGSLVNKGLREEVRLGPDYRRQRPAKEAGAPERVNGAKQRSLSAHARLLLTYP